MSKLSVILCSVLLVSVVCADEELNEAKNRCMSSLNAAVHEMTEKYHSLGWHKFDKAVQDEAFQIYQNGRKEMNLLRLDIVEAVRMEVTEEVKTHSGTIIECSVNIAHGISEITHKVFEGLDELYARVAGGKGRA